MESADNGHSPLASSWLIRERVMIDREDISHLFIDGGELTHRAWHRLPPLTNPDGHPVSVLLGVIRSLSKLSKRFPGFTLWMAFDRASAKRLGVDPQYKAHRVGSDTGFRWQVRELEAALPNFGVRTMAVEGMEADEILALWCRETMRAGQKTVVSSDKDFIELIDARTSLFDDRRTKFKTLEWFKQTYPTLASPILYVNIKALSGDVSDGIKGYKGVGETTALKKHTPVVQAMLPDGGELFRRNVALVALPRTARDLLPEVRQRWAKTWAQVPYRYPDEPRARAVLDRWGLPSLSASFAAWWPIGAVMVPHKPALDSRARAHNV